MFVEKTVGAPSATIGPTLRRRALVFQGVCSRAPGQWKVARPGPDRVGDNGKMTGEDGALILSVFARGSAP